LTCSMVTCAQTAATGLAALFANDGSLSGAHLLALYGTEAWEKAELLITASISAKNRSRRVTLPLCAHASDANVRCSLITSPSRLPINHYLTIR